MQRNGNTENMRIETERLIITEFDLSMAESVHINSLDEDNRRFVPDEVFETVEEAKETLEYLIAQYDGEQGPYVYPILLKNGKNIGYVQAVRIDEGWEIGYHIGKEFTKQGYATEAVKAFCPFILKQLEIDVIIGVCLADNIASRIVMERSGFIKKFEGIGNYQGKPREICRYIYKIQP